MNPVDSLHPAIRPLCLAHLEACEAMNLPVRVTQAYRDPNVQRALWFKGRDAMGNIVEPAKIVTHAKPGWSWHEYGLAYDVVLIKPSGEITWDDIDINADGVKDWLQVGIAGEKLGLIWGGRWKKIVDMPHFEFHPGIEIRQAVAMGAIPHGYFLRSLA